MARVERARFAPLTNQFNPRKPRAKQQAGANHQRVSNLYLYSPSEGNSIGFSALHQNLFRASCHYSQVLEPCNFCWILDPQKMRAHCNSHFPEIKRLFFLKTRTNRVYAFGRFASTTFFLLSIPTTAPVPQASPPLDKRGVSAGRSCLSLMYQYQFLPPPISSHYGLAKMRYIKRTLIASLLITRLRGLLTLLKSVKYISSLFQEQVSMPCQDK